MKINLAFSFLFSRRGWFLNLLLLTVCQFIPVIGPVVVLGYQAELAVALEHDDELKRHPRFNFDRFGQYLNRGVWPFLISLLFSFVLFPVMIVVYLLEALVLPAMQNNPLFVILAVGVLVGAALFELLIAMLSTPMTFHAKVTGRFDLDGAFRFAFSFWRRVFWVAIGTGIAYVFQAFLVIVLGLLCCFVGIYPAATIIQVAGTHLMVQLYRIYLDRGGEPLREYRERRRRWDDEDEEDEEYEDEP